MGRREEKIEQAVNSFIDTNPDIDTLKNLVAHLQAPVFIVGKNIPGWGGMRAHHNSILEYLASIVYRVETEAGIEDSDVLYEPDTINDKSVWVDPDDFDE